MSIPQKLIDRLHQFELGDQNPKEIADLCRRVVASFLDEQVAVDEAEWPPRLVQTVGSLVIKAAASNLEPPAFAEAVGKAGGNSSLISALVDAYSEKFEELAEGPLKTVGWKHPSLVDIDWRLCGVMESDQETGIKEPLAEITFTSLATNETKTEDFSFLCTKRQLQDMKWKVQEAYNLLQKMASQ